MAASDAAKNTQGNRRSAPSPKQVMVVVPQHIKKSRREHQARMAKSDPKPPKMPNGSATASTVYTPPSTESENEDRQPDNNKSKAEDAVILETPLQTVSANVSHSSFNARSCRYINEGPSPLSKQVPVKVVPVVKMSTINESVELSNILKPGSIASGSRPSSTHSLNIDAPPFVSGRLSTANDHIKKALANIGSNEIASDGPTQPVHPNLNDFQFGGLPGSQNPSPAPLHGLFSPPGMPQHMARYPIMPPPGFGPRVNVGGMPNTGFDFGHRQSHSFAPSPVEGPAFDNTRQPFGVSTPRSMNIDTPPQGAGFGHTRGDSSGIFDPSMESRRGSTVPFGSGQVHRVDDYDGLVEYIKGLFMDSTLADYRLEIVFPEIDGKKHPSFLFWGHSAVLSRSPVLKQLILESRQTVAQEPGPRPIVLVAGDYFARGDSFWEALHRMYGGPLLTTDHLPNPDESRARQPRTAPETDKFDLALGYAVAGHLLHAPPITIRGIDIACHFLSWGTVEKALDFGLRGGLHPHWAHGIANFERTGQSYYGPHADILVGASMNFLIANFPSSFIFDVNAPDAKRNQRLPERLAKKHNPKLSAIKFGELPSEQDAAAVAKEMSVDAILSRILVNLHYPLLKHLLESKHLGAAVQGVSPGLRSHFMHEIVREREKRRCDVKSDARVTDEVRAKQEYSWLTVGWAESVTTEPVHQVAVLARYWVDYKLGSHGSQNKG